MALNKKSFDKLLQQELDKMGLKCEPQFVYYPDERKLVYDEGGVNEEVSVIGEGAVEHMTVLRKIVEETKEELELIINSGVYLTERFEYDLDEKFYKKVLGDDIGQKVWEWWQMFGEPKIYDEEEEKLRKVVKVVRDVFKEEERKRVEKLPPLFQIIQQEDREKLKEIIKKLQEKEFLIDNQWQSYDMFLVFIAAIGIKFNLGKRKGLYKIFCDVFTVKDKELDTKKVGSELSNRGLEMQNVKKFNNLDEFLKAPEGKKLENRLKMLVSIINSVQ